MSGLKINFSKSVVMVTGVTAEELLRIDEGLNCKLGSLPMKYLGIPVSDKSLLVADWHFLTEKVVTGLTRGKVSF
jgi:hypothetical protein